MITMREFKTACNAALKRAAPDITIYGNDTTDGYKRPSFFTELIPHGRSHDTRNYLKDGATFKATLLEITHDEVLCLDLYDRITEEFGMVLAVGDRKLTVGDISCDFIGENANMLQVSVEFDWYSQKERIVEEPMIDSVEVNMTGKDD